MCVYYVCVCVHEQKSVCVCASACVSPPVYFSLLLPLGSCSNLVREVEGLTNERSALFKENEGLRARCAAHDEIVLELEEARRELATQRKARSDAEASLAKGGSYGDISILFGNSCTPVRLL